MGGSQWHKDTNERTDKSSEAELQLVVKWLRNRARGCGWKPQSLVLTRLAGISMHFTRGEAFRIAPGPCLPEGEPFPDICQEVVNDTAIVLWH